MKICFAAGYQVGEQLLKMAFLGSGLIYKESWLQIRDFYKIFILSVF